MPAIMTLGGIALSVVGLVIAFAGMPDRAAGLGLGSDLIHTGAAIFVGGLIIAALGQVLKALRDMTDRIEDAGFGLTGSRASMNDALSDRAPMPLPRAGRNQPPAARQEEDFGEEDAATPPPRAQRGPQAPVRAPMASEGPRAQPRMPVRPAPQAEENFDREPQDEFAEEFSQQPDARPAPRWMRSQPENGARPQPAGTIPLQSNRSSRANPVAPPPRREAPPVAAPDAYDAPPRRRAAPAPLPEEGELGEPTVVRSGIIAGMAYTLYSDRSIEAELPAGTVRFGSIEELQEHVKRAGVDEQDEYRGPNSLQH